MRWIGGRQSANIEDRRGMRIGPGLVGGGIGGVVLVLIALFLGVDPTILLDEAGPVPRAGSERAASPEEDRMRDFVATVLADTEDTWQAIFNRQGGRYEEPTLAVFDMEGTIISSNVVESYVWTRMADLEWMDWPKELVDVFLKAFA